MSETAVERRLREMAEEYRTGSPPHAACLAGADALRRGTCAWTENENGAWEGTCAWTENENGAWDTACGRTWEFTHDGPVENRMTYCMGCGGLVHAPSEPTR